MSSEPSTLFDNFILFNTHSFTEYCNHCARTPKGAVNFYEPRPDICSSGFCCSFAIDPSSHWPCSECLRSHSPNPPFDSEKASQYRSASPRDRLHDPGTLLFFWIYFKTKTSFQSIKLNFVLFVFSSIPRLFLVLLYVFIILHVHTLDLLLVHGPVHPATTIILMVAVVGLLLGSIFALLLQFRAIFVLCIFRTSKMSNFSWSILLPQTKILNPGLGLPHILADRS